MSHSRHCGTKGNNRQAEQDKQEIKLDYLPELSAEYFKISEKWFFLGRVLSDTLTGTLMVKKTHFKNATPLIVLCNFI
jgi:hypothetical protein